MGPGTARTSPAEVVFEKFDTPADQLAPDTGLGWVVAAIAGVCLINDA